MGKQTREQLRDGAKEVVSDYVGEWFSAAKTDSHPIDSFTYGQVLDMIVRVLLIKESYEDQQATKLEAAERSLETATKIRESAKKMVATFKAGNQPSFEMLERLETLIVGSELAESALSGEWK